MIVKIDKLSHDFKGISKVNDKVTFINNALPDEVVDIKITNEKKNYNDAKVISIIEKSMSRCISKCQYFDKCGGCSTGNIEYSKTLEYKKNIVKDIMKKYANIEVDPNIIYDNNIFYYRNKISLKVFNGKLALTEENSNNLTNINNCLLVNDRINEIINILNTIDLLKINNVIIKGVKEIMVIINGDIDNDILINKLCNYVNSIILNNKTIFGEDYINITVSKYKYAIYPNSFFQINTNMISKLYDKVKEYAGKGNTLLDLYCGAGTIGIYLSDNFNSVKGIEINEDAVISANLNKKINNIKNINFECKNANKINIINEDVVVVDPPRSGLDDITIKLLNNSNSKKIVYVSCNPITLARDINILKNNYTLKDITLFDMFPNTRHVESVVVLERIVK